MLWKGRNWKKYTDSDQEEPKEELGQSENFKHHNFSRQDSMVNLCYAGLHCVKLQNQYQSVRYSHVMCTQV